MSLAAPATPFPFIHASAKRRKNVWYSTGSGNWTDSNIWMCNALTPIPNLPNQYPAQGSATYVYPRVGDDVYIGFGHTVTVNSDFTLNNLYVSGVLQADAIVRNMTINGDIQATGTVNLSNAAHQLYLLGVNNSIATFNGGTSSTVNYVRVGDQPIMAIPYRHLLVRSLNTFFSGTKYLTGNTTVLGNYTGNDFGFTTANGKLECGIYDFTVNGTSTWGLPISKTGAGNLLFVGLVTIGNNIKNSAAEPYIFSFTGNPTVEFRGGISSSNVGGNNNTNVTGTGTWKFTTNNQSISSTSGSSQLVFDCPILISGAITLTITTSTSFNTSFGTYNAFCQINNTINGDNANSKLVVDGNLLFNNTNPPMATGIFDYATNSTAVIGYVFNGTSTLPYTTYKGLYIGGTGTKTVLGTTTLGTSLTVAPGAVLELGSFDLTVGTTTYCNQGVISKTGGGNILFTGLVTLQSSTSTGLFSFTGNPSVELRGGLSLTNAVSILGSGTWTFSTNNQTLTSSGSPTLPVPVMISGAITLTTAVVGSNILTITGVLNGNNAASTFDNRMTGTSSLQYQNTQRPMLTGVLQTNAAENTFIYNAASNQDITGGTYRTLTLAGSGVKTLQGNVVVATAYTLTPPATLNTNGFTRT